MVMAQKKPKPKPKPVIEYPPVATKKWVPPDKRPKKPPPPGYQKPPGISQKLAISSLRKVWHNFRVQGTMAILNGTFSQTHKRFPLKSNGKQGSCNCIIAVAFSKIYEMEKWTDVVINSALQLGNELYLKSMQLLKEKGKKELTIPDIHNYFYIKDTKIQMALGKKVQGTLHKTVQKTKIDLQTFLKTNLKEQSGILNLQKKHFALWFSDGAYYMFDPAERNDQGKPWAGFKGDGFSVVIRVTNVDKLIDWVLEGLNKKDNCNFVFYPSSILNMVKINMSPPETLEDLKPKKKEEVQQVPAKAKSVKEEPPEGEIEEKASVTSGRFVEDPLEQTAEFAPDVKEPEGDLERPSWMKDIQVAKAEVPKDKIPIERAKAASVTFFKELIPEQLGILRATIHQSDPKFGIYAGQQSICQGIVALTMLRIRKSKSWVPKVVDDLVKHGALLHREIKKSLGDGQKVKLKNIPNKIILENESFSPEIVEYSIIGKLQSSVDEVLDLLPALKEFFRENDTCIICGPLLLAVWCEDGVYYMYDPNERDNTGLAIEKMRKVGSKVEALECEPGTACVTWYKNLKDLVDVYMNNVERPNRRDQFWLSKVLINNFLILPDPWYNFKGIAKGKWILRGTFNQNNPRFGQESRNTQCTANATMALAYSTIKPEREWTSDIIDEVLISGDKLYNNCVNYLKECNKFLHPMLMVDEIQRKFDLHEKEVHLEIEDCLVNGIISAREDFDVPNLKRGFEEFFKDNETAVVTARNISVAVWKKNDIYFYYDSHSRDDQGVIDSYGTACCLRILNLEDLAKSVEANLGPGSQDMYNINRVAVTVWEMNDQGVAKPFLNNFKELNLYKAIMRATLHERSEMFPIEHRGKQSIPMCLMVLGMMKVIPLMSWEIEVLDEAIRMGETLFVMTMINLIVEKQNQLKLLEADLGVESGVAPEGAAAAQSGAGAQAAVAAPGAVVPQGDVVSEANDAAEDEEDDEKITTDNVAKMFHVGINKITVEFEETIEGNFEENFKETLENHFSNELEAPAKPLLLESDLQTILIVKDEDAYFTFDPKARDEKGELYGKDEWSAKFEEPVEEPPAEGEGEGESKKSTDEEEGEQVRKESGGGDAEAMPAFEQEENPEGDNEEEIKEPQIDEEELQRQREAEEAERLAREQKAAERLESFKYWSDVAAVSGFACLMRFSDLDHLVEHVLENMPPNCRQDMTFTLKVIDVKNEPQTKQVFDPNTQPRNDLYAGDWNEFKEIDYGLWILRGTMNQMNQLFPEKNRGRQMIPNCYSALAFSVLYSVAKFKSATINSILKYGDKLLTYTKKHRIKEWKNTNMGLTDEEMEAIVGDQNFGIEDTCRKFCIGENMCTVEVEKDFMQGDINAVDDFEEVLNVKKALTKYFENYKCCLLSSKGLYVAIWRGQSIFYMFDANSRGPNGVKSPNGVACITRHLKLDTLADAFLKNLPTKEGLNDFKIHRIAITTGPCERERQPEPEEKKIEPIPTGFQPIIPGKKILRGTLSQYDERFGKPPNTIDPAVAIMALTFSLIHKSNTWSSPIIDEILINGNELYDKSVETLGYEFNPWSQKMTIELVKNTFKVGVLKANCELRHADQRGIIDIKGSQIQNLRQGIEKFFEENTHGVLQTKALTAGIWEEGENIYMFDASPRGKTGLPAPAGTACLMSFVNAKLAFDHIISCMVTQEQKSGEFIITPVEIIVGSVKTKRKVPPKKIEEKTPEPSPSKIAAAEERRKLRELTEKSHRKKEAKRIALIGRNKFDELPNNEAILRAIRSQANERYSEDSRNFQDLTNCIVCCVIQKLIPIDTWTCKNLDLILNLGDQLYMDSYVTFKPVGKTLQPSQVLRELYVKNAKLHMMFYKAKIKAPFLHSNLMVALTNIFQQENCLLLNALSKWVAIVFKAGFYYLFDPRDYDHEGKKTEVGKGSAVVIRYESIPALCSAILYHMIDDPSVSIGDFETTFIRVRR